MSQRTLHISNDLSLPQDTVTSTLIVYGDVEPVTLMRRELVG